MPEDSGSWRRLWNRFTRGKLLILPLLFAFLALMIVLVALPGRGSAPLLGGSLFGHGAAAIGSLDVASDPPARQVFVDEQPAGEETPVRLASITAGTHKVGLDLGPCGIWETEVRVQSGQTARVAPHLTGSIEVTAADLSREGRVWVEGSEKATLPVRLDSLPVGWNRIFYEDSRVTMWDRLVLVRPEQTSSVVVPNRFGRDQGVVTVESLLHQARKGLLDSEGDTVWVDGRVAGVTPFESALIPGLHSVRVSGHGCGAYSEVLELKPGAARHVLAQLDPGTVPSFHHVAPGKVLVRGPLLLSVEITGADSSPELRPTLHLPELSPGAREIPLSLVDPQKNAYVGVVNPEDLPMWRPVSYYFTINRPDGETVWSDLYKFTPQQRWGGGASKAASAPSLSRPDSPSESAPAQTSASESGTPSSSLPRPDPGEVPSPSVPPSGN